MPNQTEIKRTVPDNPALHGAADGRGTAHRQRPVATQIFGWTNNLIATAVVIVIALAVGTHLIAWWRPAPEPDSGPPTSLQSWSTMESCALVFGDSPHSLIHEQTNGAIDDVYDFLTKKVTAVLERSPDPVGSIGPEEMRMLTSTQDLPPFDERTGKWRLFQVRDPLGRGLPTVIGIRDDCMITQQNQQRSRMTVWGIAMPSSENEWTSFTSFASAENKSESSTGRQFELPTPDGSRKTVSLADPQDGSQMVGFVGGSISDSIAFYESWATANNWSTKFNSVDLPTLQTDWQQTFLPPEKPNDDLHQVCFRVVLNVGANNQVRGLVVTQPNTTQPSTKMENKEFAK